MLTDGGPLTNKSNAIKDKREAGYDGQRDTEIDCAMRNHSLFTARPDACPEDLAGRQDASPKPQGGSFIAAPAFFTFTQPASPSAHRAGGDARFHRRSANPQGLHGGLDHDDHDFVNLINDDNDVMDTCSNNDYPNNCFNDYFNKEDYDRSTIMGNASSMGGSDTCDLVAPILSAYQDGELDTDQTRLVAAHVGKCPRCAEMFDALQETDAAIEREWRESAPLPSSLRFEQAINGIMASLPPVPAPVVAFAPRRVHARARWTRFAAALTGASVLIASLWSSYQLGYTRGRSSVAGSIAASSLSLLVPSSSASRLLLTPAAFLLPSPSPAPSASASASAPASFLSRTAPAFAASDLPCPPLRHSPARP